MMTPSTKKTAQPEVIQLDRRIFAKVIWRKSLPLRLTIFLENRGTMLLVCFTVGTTGYRYTRLMTWEELLIAGEVDIPKVHTYDDIAKLLISLSPERRRRLYSLVGDAAVYDKEQDEVVLRGAFAGVAIAKSGGADNQDYTPNVSATFKDPSVGPCAQVIDGKSMEIITEVSQLVNAVWRRRCQLMHLEYSHEIGEQVPVRYFPGGSPETSSRSTDSAAKTKGNKPGTAGQDGLKGSLKATAVSKESPTKKLMARLFGEEESVFNKGVKVLHELHRVKTWYANVNLRVFSSLVPVDGDVTKPGQRHLRFVVYRMSSSAYSDTTITGFEELRSVVGCHHQDLLEPDREEDMITHIAHRRMVVMEGLWNPETDTYEPEGDSFTLLLKYDKIYSFEKETPIHLGGDADQAFNKDKLILDKKKRGRKVLRCVRNVQGLLLHITVFDVVPEPLDGGEVDDVVMDAIEADKLERERARKKPLEVPSLRFISFEPKTGYKSVLVPIRDAILENIGGEWSPLLELRRRIELARALIDCFALKPIAEDSPFNEIVLPWSGNRDTKILKVRLLPQSICAHAVEVLFDCIAFIVWPEI